jgi:hypothetical protein
MLESTGRVVFDGILADTAASPLWRFCRVIVKFMDLPAPDTIAAGCRWLFSTGA